MRSAHQDKNTVAFFNGNLIQVRKHDQVSVIEFGRFVRAFGFSLAGDVCQQIGVEIYQTFQILRMVVQLEKIVKTGFLLRDSSRRSGHLIWHISSRWSIDTIWDANVVIVAFLEVYSVNFLRAAQSADFISQQFPA